MQRSALLCLTAALILASANGALAQKSSSRGPSSGVGTAPPSAPPGSRGGGHHGGGRRGPGWGSFGPGIMVPIPPLTPAGPILVDDPSVNNGPARRRVPRSAVRRGRSGVPPANERRMVPNEVVIELANSVTQPQIQALQRRHHVARIESQRMTTSGTTVYRWRIVDGRPVAAAVRDLESDRRVISAQPNYQYTLQENDAKGETHAEGDAAQYELTKLRLPQAHRLAKGDNVPVAVIDSGIDPTHPELAGAVTDAFDAVGAPMKPDKHGTAVAGLIAAHGKLMGAAPDARILAVRAFSPDGASAQGTTFTILRGLDWAADHGARVINMSFAGPSDPAIARALAAAHKKGIVLVAAAGNGGAKSPPLYPAADPNVIAVTATDAGDKLFQQSNRGRYIAIAAPGADIFVPIPDRGYEVSSGTSYSAAEVSGIVALMLARKPSLTPDGVRRILAATARDLGVKGPDAMFGAGLADAYGALMAEDTPIAAAPPHRSTARTGTGAR